MAATARAGLAAPRPASRPASRSTGGPSGRVGTGRAATARAAAPAPVTRRAAPQRRPDLQVVPARRKVVWLAVVGLVGLFVVLFAVTAFQTRIAQDQLELDRIDARIADQRDQFTRLRLERAELMAPDRLMAEAVALGMEPGGATQFVSIAPEIVAQVAVSASGVPDRSRERRPDLLGAYGAVKALMDGVNDRGAE